MTTYRAALFDLDGTLLDTLADLANSTNGVMRENGWPEHPQAAYRHFVGDGLEMLIRRAIPDSAISDATVQQAMQQFNEIYVDHWADAAKPYDGVDQMLKGLADAGIILAVLSNKPHAFTKECVAGLLSDHRFAEVCGVRDDGIRKPDPTNALRIADRLGFRLDEFLYLGDTNTDMQTARAAGMFAVGATWGFRDEAELRAAGADHIIHHPSAFLDLLH